MHRGIDLNSGKEVLFVIDLKCIRAGTVDSAQPVLDEWHTVVVTVVIGGEQIPGKYEADIARVQIQSGSARELSAYDGGFERLGSGRFDTEIFLLLAACYAQPWSFLIKRVENLITQPGIGYADC